MSRLDEQAISTWLSTHPGWRRDGEEVVREYRLSSFRRALALVVEIGCLAERADHHPDLLLQYRRLTVRLSTHSVGALTSRDLQLAEEIDRAYYDTGGD
jgi:4a-hydroxytetrahydrobiopterin dehydratase